jgi:dTDP-4-amino-4,6-dideoxygalactose transaminase
VTCVLGLIPRQRANVRATDLARAARVDDRDRARRAALADSLAGLTEHPHVMLAASGRGALLALLATAERERVIVPGYTCKAVVEAARLADVTVEITDVSDGFNWAPQDVEGAAGPDSVVVVTHQFGIAGDVAGVVDTARAAGALVIEDCAAALGGWSGGRRLGSFGDAAFYSFDMSKLVHVPPKGGALTLADDGWARRSAAWLARETWPMDRAAKARDLAYGGVLAATDRPLAYRGLHTALLAGRGRATTDTPALNVKRGPFYDTAFAEWQAALALPQMRRVDELAADARTRYKTYLDGLEGCRAIRLPPHDEAQEWAPIRFPILVPEDKLATYGELLRLGVDCAFSFTHLARREGLPRATVLADSVLDLPFYAGLKPREADQVIEAVRTVDRELAR